MILLRFYALGLAAVGVLSVLALARRDRETLVRLGTLAALFTALFGVLACGVWGVAVLAAGLAVLTMRELTGLREGGWLPAWVLVPGLAVVVAATMFSIPLAPAGPTCAVIAAGSCVAGLSVVTALRRAEAVSESTLLALVLHVACGLAAMVALAAQDVARLVALLTMLQFNDGMAYVVGRRFGKRKLAPDISPNKTIEGLIGGAVGVTAIVALTRSPLLPVFSELPLGHALGLVVLVVVFGVGGDLGYSLVKRRANIKDFDSVLPGHGGVLDRIDSMVSALPLVVLWTWLWV